MGQTAEYTLLVKRADSLYNAKDYPRSAQFYSKAFQSLGWKGMSNDRYNAACSWALANQPDSAFFQLNRIATKGGYKNYSHVSTDADLTSLHSDKRWSAVLELIRKNKEMAEANLNKPLAAQLDSIYTEDQKYRQQIEGVDKKFGWTSKEMKILFKTINTKDSINLIKVKSIIDTHGWLGPEMVGDEGSATLFLVIQHSDQATQEKYLPLMRAAVKEGKAQANNLALLEDRVALGQGKRQRYGSQIGKDPATGQFYVLPLDDPDNVDKRRAEVGLQPLGDYIAHWQVKWDVAQYKKELPALEAKQKRVQK
jgi:hypothetical protein